MTDLNDVNDAPDDKPKGKAIGGKARAARLTAEQRKESSRKAREARTWKASLPEAQNEGLLEIGDITLEVAVLPDGRRVISRRSVFSALGRTPRGAKDSAEMIGEIQIPSFMDAKNLIPFINEDLAAVIQKVEYKGKLGVVKDGYDATILPLVCDLYLKAREAGAMKRTEQLIVAQKAEILVRSLAKVGIIALVDEATGYQKDRERDALAKILESFIAKEMRPWVSTYPAEFFEELCRLRGVPFKANMRRPQYFGHLVNNITYDRMAPDLRNALKEEKSKAKKGAKMHQFLSEDTGFGMLQRRLTGITTLMKASDDYDNFISLLDRVHPVLKVHEESDSD